MLSDNGNSFVMPVAPTNSGGMGGFGGDSWGWIILLLLFASGGWGNGGFGGGGYDFPWLMNGQQGINTNTNNGFRDAMMNDNITSVRDGIAGLSTQICGGFGDVATQLSNGFNGVNMAVNGVQSSIAQQMYSNQIADLERSFASQTANTQGINALQSQLADCCCENRAATADLKYTVATENCADRQALSDGIRDILANQTANTQRILDQMCNDKIDSKNEKITELQNQLNMASLRESQSAQNALITQGFANEVDQLYNRLNNCPVPTTPVYGRTPIFTCNNGCGCGA